MFRLFRYLKNYKKESIIGPVFKLTEVCFEMIVPLIMANIIDVGIKNSDKPYIYKSGIIFVVLGILGLVCALTAQYYAAKASNGFGTELRRDLFHHINTLSYSEIDKLGSHTLVTRMTADINQAQSGINILLRFFLRSPFVVIGSTIMSFMVSARLTIIFLIIAPLLSFVIYKIMSVTIPKYKNIQKTLDRINLMTSEGLSGARVIRAFSRQRDEETEFHENTQKLYSQQISAGRISALMNPSTFLIVNIAIVFIVWFGGKSVYSGFVTQGQVIALVNYMNQILYALLQMTILITSVTKMQASAQRINEIFDVKSSVLDNEKEVYKKSEDAPKIEFKNCSFSYNGNENSLENISFKVRQGETVGIIGATGSGKTTLVNLIPRFYNVSKGKVLVDGIDVKEYPLSQLRAKIGLVPQNAVLFKGTVRENMQARCKNCSDDEIWRALEIAQAKEFIEGKDGQLDYQVSQYGRNFSGGQRQRLTVARALAGSPEILILDDSASALDLATDVKMRRSIREKTQGSTVMIVSQRITSIKECDRILVLDDSRLVGQGTHEELYKSCDVYKEICLSQLSEKELQDNEK